MEPPGRSDKSPSSRSCFSSGQMLDSSGDESCIQLTLGPSELALEEFRRMQGEEVKQEIARHTEASVGDNDDNCEAVLSPTKGILSGQITLLDSGDDYPWLRLTLGPSEMSLAEFKRIEESKEFYCRYCAKPYSTRQRLGGHMSNCNKKASNGPSKFYCMGCSKDFSNESALGGHMGNCKKLTRRSGGKTNPAGEDAQDQPCGAEHSPEPGH